MEENPFLAFAGLLEQKPSGFGGSLGVVRAVNPLKVAAQNIEFYGRELRCNPQLTEVQEGKPPVLTVGSTVVVITTDGWQTVNIICKVV